MIIILMGAPGSGKGTQGQTLCRQQGWEYIATGNLLRSQINEGTALGKKLESIMSEGGFPSDDIIMDVFKTELSKRADKPLLLDGIPRTLNQAKLLEQLFSDLGQSVEVVIEFKLDDAILLERILGRYTCKNCCATYHTKFNPTKKEGVCDFCGGHEFVTRKDDQEDVLKKRLELYYLETLPILEYYNSKGVVHSIDASLSPEKVGEDILTILKNKTDRGE